LMQTEPPVLPNLQDLATQGFPSVFVRDKRWGRDIPWDCKFWDVTELIPKSDNEESAVTLLLGFFRYYTTQFRWSKDAVSIRLALTPGSSIPKFDLYCSLPNDDQWYIEDPFDLRHNLGSQCTREGRQRILEKMGETLAKLSVHREAGDSAVRKVFEEYCARTPSRFLIKCRVHVEKVTGAAFAEALQTVRDIGPFTVRYPAADKGSRHREVLDAFAVLETEADRRKVHRLNETYIGEWQLRLLPCSSWALEDALKAYPYDTIEVAQRCTGDAQEGDDAEEKGSAASSDAAAEEVRSGLRAAQNKNEVKVLIQRAQALGLAHEEDLGRHKLRQLSRAEDLSGEEEPATSEGASTRLPSSRDPVLEERHRKNTQTEEGRASVLSAVSAASSQFQ